MAHRDLGNALYDQGRFEESEASFRRAVRLKPDFSVAHNNLGNVLWEQGRLEEAEESCRQALQLNPDYASAHSNLANVLRGQRRFEESEASCRRSIALKPDFQIAHNNLGNVLRDQGRPEEAEESCRQALQLNPDNALVHNNLANALRDQRRFEESEASYLRALELEPRYQTAHSNLGGIQRDLGRWEDSVASYRRAFEIEPKVYKNSFSRLADTRRHICDWSDFADTAGEMTRRVREARTWVDPFNFLSFSDDPGDQLLCARSYIKHEIFARSPIERQIAASTGHRFRLGYLSADFHGHATAVLMAELFELHDRKRFEVFAFSFGPDEQGPMRRRLSEAFDHFIDVRNMSDAEAAEQIRDHGIDIAIDLGGHTTDARPGILALRPAPVQVNYLGYPGTMGADFIDYILVDPFIVPPDQQPYYVEKLVHLPDCYQVNDTKRAIAEVPTTAGVIL